MVENLEASAVEAGHAAFGCDPDITVPGLEDLMDAALRETVLRGPGLVAKVCWNLRMGRDGSGDDSA